MNDQSKARPTDEPSGPDAKYLAVVGGLLIIIIGVLATLWLRERARRTSAENLTARLRVENKLAGQVFLSQHIGRVEPLGRSDWTLRQGTFDGRSRQVFVVEAKAGRRIGLRPGDVAVVAEEPEPTTRPAGGDADSPGDS